MEPGQTEKGFPVMLCEKNLDFRVLNGGARKQLGVRFIEDWNMQTQYMKNLFSFLVLTLVNHNGVWKYQPGGMYFSLALKDLNINHL